jgi:uncharacterized membrane protein YgcG
MPANEATIEAEISSHQYAKAESDLRGVLSAKPDSAKAHYWLGQVLGYEGHAQEGLTELARAKSIDPSLAFTTPDAFHRVESGLQASAAHEATQTHSGNGLGSNLGPSVSGTATSAHVGTVPSTPAIRHDSPAANSGFSTMNIFIGVVIVFALFMIFRRRSQPSAPPAMYPRDGVPPQGPVPPGYGTGYGYPPAPPAGGGLGSVVAGAAGGFILGEMLGHSREAGATTVVHDVVHDSSSDSNSNYTGNFDAGSSDGGSFGGDSGGGFDSGGGGDF